MARRLIISSLFFSFFHFLVFQLIFLSAKSKSVLHSTKHVPLFIFGDSFLDAGNNNYINTTTLDQANFWPYGHTFFNFPTGRFSDGRIISDFIAEYANLPLIAPFLQPGNVQYLYGVNFASAGAGVLAETFKGDVIDLKTQLKFYKEVDNSLRNKLGQNKAKMIISKAVYMFSIGSNDYMSPILTNSTIPLSNSKYVGIIIANLTIVIQEIYKLGGRKFAFINLPELGCIPAIRIIKPENNGRCLEQTSLLATLHNKALSKLLVQMEKSLKGFRYSLFDFKSSLHQRMNHPSKFGFEEGTRACCGGGRYGGVYSCGGRRIVKEFNLCKNPNNYVFWDSFHLTEKAYMQLAIEMWNGLNTSHIIGPSNMKQLFQN
ncbi:GDSL esterase/lipase 5 [Mercurialis annua]|uniref:GDSL esterase/lipase 5 n=1 Tax=Mercurialis annua TaxID=3986 RepID=UPI0021603862|nr:GDSL esterase/lipase 5 [Mercurialis annua]